MTAAPSPARDPKRPRNDLLLRAMAHEPVERVPVWLMRQAGRADPAYLAHREQAGLPLYDLFRSPEHAVPITLLPQRLGVDALILYQDILTLLEPMGAVFHFTPGPHLAEPLRSQAQVEALRSYAPARELSFIAESIAGVLSAVDGELPLLGFAGAPFTLAAFMIEGSSPGAAMPHTLAMARQHPQRFQRLMELLTDVTAAYLGFKADCGVHGVQLFESVGHLIPRDLYERFAQPSHERIFAALAGRVPTILFVRDSPFPELMLQSGAQVLSLGAGVSLADVYRSGGGQIAVQGNVDNRILARGSAEEVDQAVQDCLDGAPPRGHILNLSHGLLPDTPIAHVERMIAAARRHRPSTSP